MQPPIRPRRRSEAQRAASRANGAKSQGPVTGVGKAVASRNSHKHGFYAAHYADAVPDNDPAFRHLLENLRQRFLPDDALIEVLVARLARVMWHMEQAEGLEGQLLGAGGAKDIASSFPLRLFNSLLRRQRMLMRRFFLLLDQLDDLADSKNCKNEPKPAKKSFYSVCCDAARLMILGRPASGYCARRNWVRGWTIFRSRAGPLAAPP